MKKLFWILYAGLSIFSLFLIWPRISQECRQDPIEIVMSYGDILRISEVENVPAGLILDHFKHAGLTSLALSASSANVLATQIPESFSLVLRVSNLDTKLPALTKNNTLIFEGPEVYGYPFLLNDVSHMLKRSGCHLGLIELYPQAGMETLAKALPSQIIRVHSIPELEMNLLKPKAAVSRYMRAIRERRVTMLYIHPYMHRRSFSENLVALNKNYVSRLSTEIREQGYMLAATKPPYPNAISHTFRLKLFSCLAFCLVVGTPILALLTGLKIRHWWAGFLTSVLITAGGAVMLSALLLDPVFLLGIVRFPFISAALVLPPLFIGAFLYFQSREITDFLKRPVIISHVLLGLLGIGIVGVYVMRSGHSSVGSVPILELEFRAFLEQIFSIRPRTKEFLIGYPALMLAFMFPKSRYRWLFAAVGSLALVSLLNSFCHLHTPLWVSAYRSVLGLGLGLIVGSICILGRRFFR